MVLHRVDRLVDVAQPFDGAVVQIEVRHPRGGRQRVGIDGEAVVLGGDLDGAGVQLLHRMVAAAMPELQLVGLRAERQGHQLVAQTDAEHRHAGVHQLANVVDGVGHRRRIAGAVAQEDAVRLPRHAPPRPARAAGNTRTSQPCADQPAQDVQLDPVVVGRDPQRSARRA